MLKVRLVNAALSQTISFALDLSRSVSIAFSNPFAFRILTILNFQAW